VSNDEEEEEQERLRSVALQNARSILAARQRAERELLLAKEVLEQRTLELSHSLALIRATLDSTADGILVIDSDQQIADYNDNFLPMWRLPRALVEERGPRAALELMWAQFEDPALARQAFESIAASASPHTIDIIQLADGRVFERCSKTQRVDERTVGHVWTFRDVTETRWAEEERQQLQRRPQLV
jgi:PAS domain-containing protein